MVSSLFALLSFLALIFTGLGVAILLIWKHKKRSSKKVKQLATTVEKLPNEVLSEIFTRLLAKQVAQMRCVSKSWNALLSDSAFIKSHLHRSIQNNDEVLLFTGSLFSFNTSSTSFKFGSSPFYPRLSRSPDVELTNFIKLPVIRQSISGIGNVIGSVNGLICFSYRYSLDEFTLHLWNPSLSALFSLPQFSLRFCEGIELGFGYESISDDYKIVKLTPNNEPQGEVYSMRKGSWNLITQRFPSHLTICRGFSRQVYVDGHVHWLCNSRLAENLQMIVAFDLDGETFNEIPLPVVYKWLNILGVLGGKLCLMSRAEAYKWEVWVMEEYGVADLWVKHHVFPWLSGIPYGFTSHGELLIEAAQYDHRLSWHEICFGLYDPIAAKMMLNFSESRVVEYVDSLVWVAPPSHKSDKVSLL